jgi:alkyl sulfatase BDS1-like metallo-beta-lactamase superfamily hydrolase
MATPLWKSRPGEPYPATHGSQPINDFIHLSEGFSNSFLITTDAGRIIVNTGQFHEAPYHKANYDAISNAKTRYIILTQGHVDHVGGVDYLREEGTEVIAHVGNAEHQSYDKRLAPFRGARSAFAFKEKVGNAVKLAIKEFGKLPAQASPVPDITFEDRFDFELGGLRVELIGVKGGETNDSLIIWLPDHKICFTGNLFGCLFGHFPNLVTIRGDRYRDAQTVAAAVDVVIGLEPELLLVGHHQPVEGSELIQEELVRLRDATRYVHDATVAGMNEGKDLHTLMQEIVLPKELEVGEGYGKVSWSVRAIWENYAGWFHHESTTELYSLPQRAIHADLIELAGGPLKIVERARERLAEKEPEAALHLLDILLSQPEPPDSALAVAVEAHQLLASRSVNFWLTAWLRNQIERLGEQRSRV